MSGPVRVSLPTPEENFPGPRGRLRPQGSSRLGPAAARLICLIGGTRVFSGGKTLYASRCTLVVLAEDITACVRLHFPGPWTRCPAEPRPTPRLRHHGTYPLEILSENSICEVSLGSCAPNYNNTSYQVHMLLVDQEY
ncbi:unnamed protein product [Arctogadus glacialis]